MKHSRLAMVFALAAAFVLGEGVGYVAGHGEVSHKAGLETAAAPRIGCTRPEGVYAGISPDTDKLMYTTAKDAPGTYDWYGGNAYCAALEKYGHQDWRMPTKGELNELFKGRAAIGGFNVSGSIPAGWYWSSSQFNRDSGWDQRFSDGGQYGAGKRDGSSLRCVR